MRGVPAAALILVVAAPAFTLPGAAAAAPTGGVPAGSWWRRFAAPVAPPGDAVSAAVAQGLLRTRQGRYAEAAAAYGAALAAGADRSSSYASIHSNLGEVLMADGQLGAAEACYRDAIAAASGPSVPGTGRLDDPRGRAQDLVLAYLGLAVALDRDGQPRASNEMMARALNLDATMAVLAVAAVPNENLFFVPEGEVDYYRGLAEAAVGRRREAADAFRDFLERAPRSRWASRAEAHLAELAAAPGRSTVPPPARRPRVLAAGTVLATGGTAAPFIDAAWREQGAILDDCFAAAPALAVARAPVRLAVEMEIDRRGRVTSATIKLPAASHETPPDETLSRCLSRAIETQLRLPPPPTARSTRARTELLIGFPSIRSEP